MFSSERRQGQKEQYDDIFIVLTYKNTNDVVDLLASIRHHVRKYRIIIVNSFFNEETRALFKEIAEQNDCDFLPVENRGYGAGNNAGIRHALANYECKRIVISNPDVVIKEYDQNKLDALGKCIVGGRILNKSHGEQNPIRVTGNWFLANSAYYLYEKRNAVLFCLSVGLAKIQRLACVRFTCSTRRVFAVHGSFFIIPLCVADAFEDFFDERIYMFQEEIDIAYRMKTNGVPVVYTNSVCVLHKEDGDVGNSNLDDRELMRKSSEYVYNKWKGLIHAPCSTTL